MSPARWKYPGKTNGFIINEKKNADRIDSLQAELHTRRTHTATPSLPARQKHGRRARKEARFQDREELAQPFRPQRVSAIIALLFWSKIKKKGLGRVLYTVIIQYIV